MSRGEVLRQILPYGAALAVSKGIAFLLLPILTRHLTPEAFALWDLLATVADMAGLALGLGLAEALYRFSPQKPETPAALLGLAITAAAVWLLLGQGLIWLLPTLPFDLPRPALQALAGSLALVACIEVPLAALKFQGRSGPVALIIAGRALLQAGLILGALYGGYGIVGMAVATLITDCVIALILLAMTVRHYGLNFTITAWRPALAYGTPVAAGGWAGFVLGSCDRWFLVGAIAAASLAHYALAAKIALVVALAAQPFGLWWYPRRIGLAQTAWGRDRSAAAVGAGLLLLILAVAAAMLLGPLVIEAITPPAFHAAARWVGPLALAFALHEAASLLNVGSYLGVTGGKPFLINWLGALVALAGYSLIPFLGDRLAPEAIAIGATLAAHGVRIGLFLWVGRTPAPIPYPWVGVAGFAALATLLLVLIESLAFEGIARWAVAALSLSALAGVGALLAWGWSTTATLPTVSAPGESS